MFQSILDWLESKLRSDETQGAVKRLATAAAMVATPVVATALNSKLHLELSDTVISTGIVSVISGLGLYMLQSVANTIHARSVAAAAGKQQVTNIQQALAILNGSKTVPPPPNITPVQK